MFFEMVKEVNPLIHIGADQNRQRKKIGQIDIQTNETHELKKENKGEPQAWKNKEWSFPFAKSGK